MLFTISNIDIPQGVIETMNLGKKICENLHSYGFP